MAEQIKGDPYLEQHGVQVEYLDDIILALARAGGSNAAFTSALTQEMKPYKLAIVADRLTEETCERILARVYARTIIKKVTGPDCPEAGNVSAVAGWLLADLERFADIRAIAENGEHYVDMNGEPRIYG